MKTAKISPPNHSDDILQVLLSGVDFEIIPADANNAPRLILNVPVKCLSAETGDHMCNLAASLRNEGFKQNAIEKEIEKFTQSLLMRGVVKFLQRRIGL